MPVTTSNVSSTYLSELTRDEILRRAFQVAGLKPASVPTSGYLPGELELGSDLMLAELDALQAEGITLRTQEFKTLTLTGGTGQYTLPTDTLDVRGVAKLVQSTGVESGINPMSRDEWQDVGNRTTTGTPTRYYVTRQASVLIDLWPKPSTVSPMPSVRYQQVRFLKDADGGDKTIDLERYYIKWLIWEMAHQLAVAFSKPLDRCMYLANEARKLLEKAKGYNRPHGPGMFYLAHRAPQVS